MDIWKKYEADFNAMSDADVEHESEQARQLIEENEQWLEAVASWESAGRPRAPRTKEDE